jgi:hypothetical protein
VNADPNVAPELDFRRGLGDEAADCGGFSGGGQMRLSLTPDTWRAIGYARDTLVILVIAVGGMYVLSSPKGSMRS